MATISLTNLISNGGFETNTTGWAAAGGYSGTLSSLTPIPTPGHGESGTKCLNATGQFNSNAGGGANRIAVQLSSGLSVTANHVYYIRAQVRTQANCNTCEFNNNGTSIGSSMVSTGTNVWNLIDLIYEPAVNATLQLRLQFGGAAGGNNATTLQFDNVMMIDLTAAFGAGNEPPDSVIRDAVIHHSQSGYWDGTQSVNIAVAPVIDAINYTLPLSVKGKSYSGKINLETDTGTAPFTFSLLGLPSNHGLSIDGSGVISGTSNLNENSYKITVSVTDSLGYIASQSFTLNAAEPPEIVDTYIPGGAVGEPYLFVPTIGGTKPDSFYTISIASGVLPSGLSIDLDPVSGNLAILGTPVVTGICQISIYAENYYGDTEKIFTFGVYAAPSINTLSLLANGTQNSAYSVTLTASGATPITWSVDSGSLPTGVSLNASTGVISGTPSVLGTYSFVIKASNSVGDDFRQFEISIYALPVITTTSFGYARIGSPYSGVLNASGSAPITWTRLSGTLPPGLTLDSETGIVSGNPSTTGIYTFTIEARNIVGADTKQFTIASGDALAITTTSPLPNGAVGVAYSTLAIQVAGINTLEAYTFSWAAQAGSSLPPGISFSGGTVAAYGTRGTQGQLSGTPTTAGTYNITITVVNGSSTASSPFTITVGTPPTITSGTSLTGGVSRPGTTVLTASGSTPITWAMSGSPSGGANINIASNGVVTWNIPTVGNYTFTAIATNSFGNSSPVTFTLTITTPSITDVTLDNGIVGEAYSHTFTPGGVSPFTWSLASGSLPPGLSFDPATATLSGTPTTTGTSNFDIKVENAAGFAQETFTLLIVARPLITTVSLNSGNVGTAYSQTLQASGTTPITWSILTPVSPETGLPPGLSLAGAVIGGNPTTQGTYSFSVKASNVSGSLYDDIKQFTISIGPSGAPVITSGSTLSGVEGDAFSLTLTATGNATIAWALLDGSLPSGVSLSGNVISGTPTEDGIFTFTLTATNGAGVDSKSFTLTIEAALSKGGTWLNGKEVGQLFLKGKEVAIAYVNGGCVYEAVF